MKRSREGAASGSDGGDDDGAASVDSGTAGLSSKPVSWEEIKVRELRRLAMDCVSAALPRTLRRRLARDGGGFVSPHLLLRSSSIALLARAGEGSDSRGGRAATFVSPPRNSRRARTHSRARLTPRIDASQSVQAKIEAYLQMTLTQVGA